MGMDSLKTRKVKICDGLTVTADAVQAARTEDGQVLVTITYEGQHEYAFLIPRDQVKPFVWMVENAKDDIL